MDGRMDGQTAGRMDQWMDGLDTVQGGFWKKQKIKNQSFFPIFLLAKNSCKGDYEICSHLVHM